MVVMIRVFTLKLNPLLLLLLLLLFFLFTPSTTPLNFSFSSFNANSPNTIFTEGDAYFENQFLRLTRNGVKSVGRATYRQPFLLRENTTGKLADFTANFNFSINSDNRPNYHYGDGLAFFLAPHGSFLNATIGRGGSLGLPINSTPSNVTVPRSQYPFVAVEFDIYKNVRPVFDPEYDHVGIDVNSINSSITEPWNGGILEGETNSATVTYNSTSKNLSVAFTTFVESDVNNTQLVQVVKHLHYVVDLKEYLPDWVVAGLSASTFSNFALHTIISWNFVSTSLVDQNGVDIPTGNTPPAVTVPTPSPTVSTSNPKSVNDHRIGLAIGLGIGGCAILVGGLGLVFFIFWKKRDTGENSDEDPMVHEFIDEEFQRGAGPRKFSYIELARATSNFAEENKLGQGGFGWVYKGFISDLESYVAVKRISNGSKQGPKEYASEVTIISQLRHRNLVQLIGWCHERKFLLVYELMPNGSLDSHLFKEQSLLTWEARYKVAQGLASGLFYLHHEWEQCVLHRDIKSSNVMLDSNFNAKLGDFGLARLVDHGEEPQTTALAGTLGYMAPEYVITGKASKESDVYSFGIVALEISCGRKPIDRNFTSSQINMVEWVWELYGEGKLIEAVDSKLCGDFDEKQLECLMIVGLWCAHPDYNKRPSIQQAIQVLNFEVPLPILPSKMPVATYFAPQKTLEMLFNDTSGSQGGQIESSSDG